MKASILLLLLSAGVFARAAPAATLENPSVRLWYEGTGHLSDSIATPRGFALWNIIIGGGDAKEHANDALFTVELRSHGEQNIAQPVLMTATTANGKLLAWRTVRHVLTSEAGRVVLPLWVSEVACAGRVLFVARYGAMTRSVTLNFACGE